MKILKVIFIVFLTIFMVRCDTNTQNEVFCINVEENLLNEDFKLSNIVDEAHKITDATTISKIALMLQDDTVQYGNWVTYYQVPNSDIHPNLLILRQDDNSIREYIACQSEANNSQWSIIEVAADVGDGADFLNIYSEKRKDSLYIYTVKTTFFLTKDDTIDETQPPIRDTLINRYGVNF